MRNKNIRAVGRKTLRKRKSDFFYFLVVACLDLVLARNKPRKLRYAALGRVGKCRYNGFPAVFECKLKPPLAAFRNVKQTAVAACAYNG